MTDEEVAISIAKHDKDIKSLEHRMDEVETVQKSILDLTTSVRELTINLQHMVEEQKNQSERISKLEDEPIERRRTIRNAIITATASGIVSLILGFIVGWLTH